MDIHVVRAGETVSSVAARYGVPAGILAGVNGVAPDAPLAVGQTLVVRHPRELHTVTSGESVYSIALRYGLSVRTLYQNNPALGGRSALYPGQTLVIAYDDTPTRTLAVNAYSYPFIRGGLLDAALPYLTYLTPFTYGINADGTLLPLADEWLLAAAGQYRTAALMHLSTLTEEGRFDNARSTLILEEADAQDALVQSILETVQARHYFGLDVDFEYVLPEQREAYAAFITRLREALNPLGCPVIVALAPKTSAAQRGLLYEAHDYALLGAALHLLVYTSVHLLLGRLVHALLETFHAFTHAAHHLRQFLAAEDEQYHGAYQDYLSGAYHADNHCGVAKKILQLSKSISQWPSGADSH